MLEFDFDFLLSYSCLEGSFDLSSSPMNLGSLGCIRFFDHFSVGNSNCHCICLGFYFEILFHGNLESSLVESVLGLSSLVQRIYLGTDLQLALELIIR